MKRGKLWRSSRALMEASNGIGERRVDKE